MVSVDLITHNSVSIAAPAAQVWPWIIDTNAWKQGTKLALVDGAADQPGGRFGAYLPKDPTNILLEVTNAEVVPEVRRTIRLNAPGGALMCFASWKLSPDGETTIVEYDVYGVAPVELPASYTDHDKQRVTGELRAQSEERFNAELAALRDLAVRQTVID